MLSEYLLKKAGISAGKVVPFLERYLATPAKKAVKFSEKPVNWMFTGKASPTPPPTRDVFSPEMQAQLRNYIKEQNKAVKRQQVIGGIGAGALTGATTYAATQNNTNKQKPQPTDNAAQNNQQQPRQ